MNVVEKLSQLDQKIQALEKRKEQIEMKMAFSFFKRAKKIWGDEFYPSFVLETLEQIWILTSEIQKQEWRKRGHSFRLSSFDSNGKKTPPSDPTHYQS